MRASQVLASHLDADRTPKLLIIICAMPTPSDRGLFVWHELNTTDIESAERFYSKLIGWKTRPWDPNPAYKIWTMGREGRGGLYSIHEEPNAVTPPPHWLSYIGTADVDATVRQAVELGGKVVTPAYDVAGVGRMAVLHDPQGAMFAVSAQVERSRYKDPQLGDFSWHELLTTNWQTAFDFYSKLFGWEKMQAMDMGPQGTYQIYRHRRPSAGRHVHARRIASERTAVDPVHPRPRREADS